jgi:hypothetical protein
MKNLHVLPTEKPSRIRIGDNGNFVFGLMQNSIASKNDSYTNHNIYITSDEEIKEGDWFMSDFNSFPIHNIKELSEREGTLGWEQKDLKNNLKIILTTDQDLIKDGVQAIDDEFLEWFVNNPSCDEIKVNNLCYGALGGFADAGYKIIIPKEEPKQELPTVNGSYGCTISIKEPKQKTLEEVAERVTEEWFKNNCYAKELFIEGVKWQQEQDKNKYSEEDLREAFIEGYKQRAEKSDLIFDNASIMYAIALFKQFKNK